MFGTETSPEIKDDYCLLNVCHCGSQPLLNIDGLVQERRNSSALAMELCLSCTNPSIYDTRTAFIHKIFFVIFQYFYIINVPLIQFSVQKRFSYKRAGQVTERVSVLKLFHIHIIMPVYFNPSCPGSGLLLTRSVPYVFLDSPGTVFYQVLIAEQAFNQWENTLHALHM